MNDKKDGAAPAEGDAKGAAPKKPLVNSQQLVFFGILAAVVVINVVVALVLVKATRPVSPEESAAKVAAADSLKNSHGGEAAAESHGGHGASAEEGEPIDDPIEAIVNIAGTDGERFLKVVLLLCYDMHKYPKMMAGGGGHGGGGGGIGAKKAIFKDYLIEILSQMTLSELAEPETKTKIRKDFLRRVNSTMSPETGEYNNVLIDEFIIQ